MPVVATVAESMTSPSVYVYSVDTAQDREFRRFFESDAIRSVVKEIKIAGVVYPLRRESSALFIPVKGEFTVSEVLFAIDDTVYVDLREHFDEGSIVELGLQCANFVGVGRLAATWAVTDALPERFRAAGEVTPWGTDAVVVG